jgi:hypothetical protein
MVPRTFIAFAVAPLAGVLVAWAGVYAMATHLLHIRPAIGAAPHTLFFFVFFGSPVAYLIAALVGVPAVRALRRRQRLQLVPLATAGTVAGAAVFTAAWATFWGGLAGDEWVPFLVIGALAGSSASAVFWGIGLWSPRPRPVA